MGSFHSLGGEEEKEEKREEKEEKQEIVEK